MKAVLDKEGGTYQLHLVTHWLEYPQASYDSPEAIENSSEPHPFKINLFVDELHLFILDIVQEHVESILCYFLLVDLAGDLLLIVIVL